MQIRATQCPCPILHSPRISPCCFISGQRQIWQNNICGCAFLLCTWKNISRDQIWLNSNLNSTIKWFWDGYACRFVWFWFQSWFQISNNFWIVSSSQSFQQCNDTFSFKICTFLITFTTYSENLISEKCIFKMNSGDFLWNIRLKGIENKIGGSRFRFKIRKGVLLVLSREKAV